METETKCLKGILVLILRSLFLMKLNSENKLTFNYSTFFDIRGGEKSFPSCK